MTVSAQCLEILWNRRTNMYFDSVGNFLHCVVALFVVDNWLWSSEILSYQASHVNERRKSLSALLENKWRYWKQEKLRDQTL